MEEYNEEQIQMLMNTSHERASPHTPIYYVESTILTAVYLIVITANILLIYMNKSVPKTRTNRIILHWSLSDLLYTVYLLAEHITSFFMDLEQYKYEFVGRCVLIYMDMAFRFPEMLFILELMSNTLVRNKNISSIAIFGVPWVLTVVVTALNISLCFCNVVSYIGVIAYLMLFNILLIIAIIKNINGCVKRNTNPISDRTRLRLNVASIYVFNWFITWGSVVVVVLGGHHWLDIMRSQYLIGYMSVVCILIYLIRDEPNYRACYMKIFKRGGGRSQGNICFSNGNNEEDCANVNTNGIVDKNRRE